MLLLVVSEGNFLLMCFSWLPLLRKEVPKFSHQNNEAAKNVLTSTSWYNPFTFWDDTEKIDVHTHQSFI